MFPKLLRHHKANIVKEAAWTLSNITAGTTEQIQMVIDHGLVGDLINILQNGDFKSKKEATWAVTNLTSGGKPEQVATLIELGVLEPLVQMLNCGDAKIVQVLNMGLYTQILKHFKGDIGRHHEYSESR